MVKTKFVIKITDAGFRLIKCIFKKGRWGVVASEKDVFDAASPEETITKKAGAALKKLKFKKEPLAVALPQNIVVLRQFRVPSLDAGEIAGMAGFRALRYMPYPAEEMVTAYSLIRQDDQGYSYINLNVVHRKDTDRLLKILNPWVKNIEAFVLSSYGFAAAGVSSQESPAIIVNIEETCADILIVRGDRLLFGRSAAIAPQEDGSGEKLAGEIDKTVKAYRRENIDSDPATIIIAQASGGRENFLKEKTGLLVKELDLTDTALAAVLNFDEKYINLLPDEIKEKNERFILQDQLGRIAVLFLAGFLALSFSFAVTFYGYQAGLNRLKEERNEIYPKIKDLIAIKQKREALSKKGAKTRAIDVLAETYRIMPDGLYLNSLSYAQDREVLLRGRTQNLSNVLNSLSLFEKSGIFKGGKINYATKRKTKGAEIVEFEIVARLR